MNDEVKDEGIDFGDGTDNEGLVIDLNSVEDQQFEVLPRGMYNCVVDSLEFGYSQNSGNPMWTWTLAVAEGEYEGRKLFFHTVWQGAGLPRTKAVVSRVAPELMEGPFDPEKVADAGTLLDRRVKARVDTKKYEGSMRNNVRDLFAAEESEGFGI